MLTWFRDPICHRTFFFFLSIPFSWFSIRFWYNFGVIRVLDSNVRILRLSRTFIEVIIISNHRVSCCIFTSCAATNNCFYICNFLWGVSRMIWQMRFVVLCTNLLRCLDKSTNLWGLRHKVLLSGARYGFRSGRTIRLLCWRD